MKKISFISEVCSNHNASLKRSYKFIDESAKIGCDSVKFQLFKINKLFRNQVLKKSKNHRDRERWELPEKFIPDLAHRCFKKKIKFSCTPFYIDAVRILRDYVSFYKISSYDILRKDLLSECAKTKKPVIISTGMATLKEIKAAYKILSDNGCKKIIVMHCVSNYPVKIENVNLSIIRKYKKYFGNNIGWSDHSKDYEVILRAIKFWKANHIEFHMDIDKKGFEYKMNHCWLPNEILKVIRFINGPHIYDGNEKFQVNSTEIKERKWRADPADGLRPLKD